LLNNIQIMKEIYMFQDLENFM